MTTPAERTEAVKLAIVIATSNPFEFPRTTPEEREAVRRFLLRHLPTLGELELTHEKCPELWGKP